MIFNTIVVSLTDKCSAECKMCCFSCKPSNTNVLEIEKIKLLVNNAKSFRTINHVSITGGEPFLFYEELISLIKEIDDCNMYSSVYTNGFWCRSYKETYNKLLILKERGLGEIHASVDAYHQEFVDLEYIKNLLTVSNELDIITNINSIICKGTIKNTESIINELGELKLNTRITFSPLLPIGSAKDNFNRNDYYYTKTPDLLKCKSNGMLFISFDGTVYPCCSQVVEGLPFKLGNIYKDDIKFISNNIRKNIPAFLILTRGLNWFIKIIRENNLFKLDENYIDACHLCHEIFSNKDLYNKLIYYMDLEYYRQKYKNQL